MSDIEYVYLVGIADSDWHDVAMPQAYKTYKAARTQIIEDIDRHTGVDIRVSSSEQPGLSYTASVHDVNDNDRMIVGLWLKRVQVLSK